MVWFLISFHFLVSCIGGLFVWFVLSSLPGFESVGQVFYLGFIFGLVLFWFNFTVLVLFFSRFVRMRQAAPGGEVDGERRGTSFFLGVLFLTKLVGVGVGVYVGLVVLEMGAFGVVVGCAVSLLIAALVGLVAVRREFGAD